METVTITGNLWHYHMIGLGLISTYNTVAKKMVTTCVHTGQVAKTTWFRNGYASVEEFKTAIQGVHIEMIDDQFDSMDLIYLDEPELVGEVWIDFNIIRN